MFCSAEIMHCSKLAAELPVVTLQSSAAAFEAAELDGTSLLTAAQAASASTASLADGLRLYV